jgi:DNA adenine methylase
MHAQKQTYDALRTEFNLRGLGLVRRAALFLALNHLCFNGLYRENKAGEFNVPVGKSATGVERSLETFPYEAVSQAHRALRRAQLSAGPVELRLDNKYSAINQELGKGDVVVLDPPYLQTFSSYNARGFGLTSHAMLSAFARRCESAGALCIVCGSHTPESLSLYGKPSRVVELKRTVGASNRGVAEECIWVFGK